MHYPKITVVTVCYNAQNTIERCIESVTGQKYNNIEYIIIDGNSTDNTLSIITKYQERISLVISEPDKGIYDAMNKGIALATGDVVGILNADDFFADEDILTVVAGAFNATDSDIVYGDLNYVGPDESLRRKWVSGEYRKGMFNFGWMPPHPTFYCKRELFRRFGGYSLDYGTAADYELMLRFIHCNLATVYYVERVLIKMAVGGVSNNSIRNRIEASLNDLKAMKNNKVSFPFIALVLKPLRKLRQFFNSD